MADPTQETTPVAPVVNVTIQQQDRAGEAAQAMLDAKALKMDESVPGGRYIVGGVLVNADGEPLKAGK